VPGETGEFSGRQGDLLGAGVFQRADALQHQRRHQDQRQQGQARANSDKFLEFGSFAVETNA
jgi:hypothetical protein